jgi:hypothetical protein
MSGKMQFPESDPRHHTAKIKQMLAELREQARQDIGKITDPKAQALFETTAEVVAGLEKAYEHFERRSEPAWTAAAAAGGRT